MSVSKDTVAALDEVYLELLEVDIITAIAKQAELGVTVSIGITQVAQHSHI